MSKKKQQTKEWIVTMRVNRYYDVFVMAADSDEAIEKAEGLEWESEDSGSIIDATAVGSARENV